MITNQATNRILVVDDDAGGRRLTRATLARAGFDVVEAENGQKAIEVLQNGMPDLILLDVSMPIKDGFETCAELRTMPGGESVPVVMMTGLDDVKSIEQAFKVGATDFITKPINWPILSHRVRYMLRASAAISAINENERRLSNAQRIGEMGDWLWDVRMNRIVSSAQAWRILGLDASRGTMNSADFMAAIHPEDRGSSRDAFLQGIKQGRGFALQHRIQHPDHSIRHVHQQVEVTARDESGQAIQLVGAVHDVTQRTDAEEQIRRLAYYDTLTGLPNRLLYLQQLQTALGYAERNSQKVAVMFIDLDNFKRINDTMGHGAGDELLKIVSARLVSSIRALDSVSRAIPDTSSMPLGDVKMGMADAPSIARLGGDEFTVMVSDIKTADDAAVVARRLIAALTEPVTINDTEIFVSGSVGVALYPDNGQDIDSLLKNADIAMYRAKEEGKSRFHFYDADMTARAVTRMKTEMQLRRALERNEFVVHYQPRVDVATNRIVGAEALLRWQHPERGLVYPSDFIGMCEEAKLIIPLGDWVIRAVCAQQAAWRDAGMALVPVAVNLAASHLRESSLAPLVRQALHDLGLPARALEIEVTESVLINDPETSIKHAKMLADSGVRLALDDFGMGYSSLSYLKRLPVSYLKIDRSFVRDLGTDASDAAIITATIAMAHMLDLRVVAEGVELPSQLDFLKAQGCDDYQGYLHSKPMVAEAFEQMIRSAQGTQMLNAA
jgi:predicted signal transduction protein with EAL and GGDEF domain/DNA-binding response OmpR family regulator